MIKLYQDLYTDRMIGSEGVTRQYLELRTACEWFKPERHYLVVISDLSGNLYRIIGCGASQKLAKPALKAAWEIAEQMGEHFQVALLKGGRHVSFVLD